MAHDFNGKKAKIIQTLRQIDELKTGVVKTVVFQNLLNCLDLEVDRDDLLDCAKKHGLKYQGANYVRYEEVLRLMHYDNHSEKWQFNKSKLDLDGASSISLNSHGREAGLKRVALRQSFDGFNARASMG